VVVTVVLRIAAMGTVVLKIAGRGTDGKAIGGTEDVSWNLLFKKIIVTLISTPYVPLCTLTRFDTLDFRNNADLGKGVPRLHANMKPGNSSFFADLSDS